MRETRLVIDASARSAISMREVRNDKAGSLYFRDYLVVNLVYVFYPIDAFCFISGGFNSRPDTILIDIVHGIIKPHRNKGLR